MAITVPVVLGLIGVAVDYASFSTQQAVLQKAADAAALAAAKELTISAPHPDRLASIAEAVVRSHVSIGPGDGSVTVEARVLPGASGVRILLAQRKSAIMSQLVTPALTDLSVSATANIAGNQKVCVVALSGQGAGVIGMEQSARITARDCAVFSNSAAPTGVVAKASALLTSPFVCSAGGYFGSSINFAVTQRLSDCPPKADPLAERPAPPVGPCTSKTRLMVTHSRTLLPGVYCGGIHVGAGATVTLAPGIFTLRGGPLVVEDGAGLVGTNVGLHFTGAGSTFLFMPGSTLRLTAPKDGPLAGILFFGDRAANDLAEYRISSDNAPILVGVIYIPRGGLTVDSSSSLAQDSPWTAIVANRLTLSRSSNMVLRTDYGLTDVPVPGGLGPSKSVRLVE